MDRMRDDITEEAEWQSHTEGAERADAPFPLPADGAAAVAILVSGQMALGGALSLFSNISRHFPPRAWGPPDMAAQALASVLVLGLLVAYFRAVRGASLRDMGLWSHGIGRDALRGLGYAVAAFVLGAAITIAFWAVVLIAAQAFGVPGEAVEKFLLKSSAREQETARGVMNVIGILVAVCAAPFIEELVFRGVLFRGLRRAVSFRISAAASAAVFTALHFYVAGAPMIFVMGLAAAWTVERRRSIMPALFMHAFWNLRVFAVLWPHRL
jgi:membrane protease YdiL (CAAX protease family)